MRLGLESLNITGVNSWSLEDELKFNIAYMDAKNSIVDTFYMLENTMNTMEHLIAIQGAIRQYGCTESIAYLYGENNISLSVEGLGETIKDVLKKIYEFIVKLKNKIVDFFKNLFPKKKDSIKKTTEVAEKVEEKVVVKEVPVEKIVKVPVEKIVEVVQTKEVFVEKTPMVDLTKIHEDEKMINEYASYVSYILDHVGFFHKGSAIDIDKRGTDPRIVELAKQSTRFMGTTIEGVDVPMKEFIKIPNSVVPLRDAVGILKKLNGLVDNQRVMCNSWPAHTINELESRIKEEQEMIKHLETHPEKEEEEEYSKEVLSENIDKYKMYIKILHGLLTQQERVIDWCTGVSRNILNEISKACVEAGASTTA